MQKKYVLMLLGLTFVAILGYSWDRKSAELDFNKYNAEMLSYRDAELAQTLLKKNPESNLSNGQKSLRTAILYHNLSLVLSKKGVNGNAYKALEILRVLRSQKGFTETESAMILSYLGSVTALQASEDWNPVAKISGVYEAYSILDSIVESHGNSFFMPRFFRSQVSREVPEMFGKRDLYRIDLEMLVKLYEANPEFDAMPEVMSDVYSQLGELYKQQGDMPRALASWKKAVRLDTSKKFGGRSAQNSLEIFED